MDVQPDAAISTRRIVKTYGPTRALDGVTLAVAPGEIRGVVGHNGAGKSTLMRVLAGIELPDEGTVHVGKDGQRTASGYPGVRMAFQETSLAGELTVAHNAYLSSSRLFSRWQWRRQARAAIIDRLDEIFPGHTIGAGDYVDNLTLAGRQMVEIARATLDDNLCVLILDEPTESLTGEATTSLYRYVRRLAESGVAIILISHRLAEVLDVSDAVSVLRDGRVVDTLNAGEISEDDLFVTMGGDKARTRQDRVSASPRERGKLRVRVPVMTVDGESSEISAHGGEIVGLAGIAGQGQEEILESIWRRSSGVESWGTSAYVPGDRQRLGIFPLWTVAENLSISSLGRHARYGVRRRRAENDAVERWRKTLQVKGGPSAMMTGLSGGNQQKVIVARALASDADVILLDDPFRGVDVHTKAELYNLLREEAEAGRCIIWYSSENSEMQYCDRAYVLRAHKVAGELHGTDIDDAEIISLSFLDSKGR